MVARVQRRAVDQPGEPGAHAGRVRRAAVLGMASVTCVEKFVQPLNCEYDCAASA